MRDEKKHREGACHSAGGRGAPRSRGVCGLCDLPSPAHYAGRGVQHCEGTSEKAREYLAVAREVVGLDEWREIVERAREDALNAAGTLRQHARIFLRDTLIGKQDRGDAWGGRDDPWDDPAGRLYDDLSDEELEAIIATGAGREDAEGADREGATSSD